MGSSGSKVQQTCSLPLAEIQAKGVDDVTLLQWKAAGVSLRNLQYTLWPASMLATVFPLGFPEHSLLAQTGGLLKSAGSDQQPWESFELHVQANESFAYVFRAESCLPPSTPSPNVGLGHWL